jgi:hypothetical protein
MVEQDGDIVAIVDVLAHRSTIQYAASGGELNPKEIKLEAFFEVVCIPHLYPARPKTQRKAGK